MDSWDVKGRVGELSSRQTPVATALAGCNPPRPTDRRPGQSYQDRKESILSRKKKQTRVEVLQFKSSHCIFLFSG